MRTFLPRRMVCRPAAMIGLLGVVLFVAGCGGSPPAKTTNAVRTPAPPPAPVAPPLVHTEPSSPPPAAPEQSAPKNEAVPSEAAAGDAVAAAGDVELFAIKGEEEWKVVGEAPLQEKFTVLARVDEKDSTQLEILSSEHPAATPRGLNGASKPLPKGAQAVPAAGYSSEGYPLRITYGSNDPCEMALVPGGTYRRGSEEGPEDARPEQAYVLDPFYMDVTEVTVAQYERMREANQKGQRGLPQPSNALADPRQPAVGISYGDALFYAKWAGKDLPSEAQWEGAVRGVEGYRFAWGNGRVVWERARGKNQIDPVGSFRADISSCGILDLMGNAREWCKDKYAPTSYKEQSGHGLLRDPLFNGRAVPNGHQAVRGNGEDWSAWCRGHASGIDRSAGIGFRCVLRLTGGSETTVRDGEPSKESAKDPRSKKKEPSGKGTAPSRPPMTSPKDSF